MRMSHYTKSGPGRVHRQGAGRSQRIHSGKLNFRRSDPRHPMYDALKERGWVVYDHRTHSIAFETDGKAYAAPLDKPKERTADQHALFAHQPKSGVAVDIFTAFEQAAKQDRDVRVPACMKVAA